MLQKLDKSLIGQVDYSCNAPCSGLGIIGEDLK